MSFSSESIVPTRPSSLDALETGRSLPRNKDQTSHFVDEVKEICMTDLVPFMHWPNGSVLPFIDVARCSLAAGV